MVDHVPLAPDLRVGLPAGLPLTEQRDLDNYLQPMVAELGHARFDAVFGSKRHQDYSTLAVTPSVPVEPDRGPDLQVTLTGSYDRPEGKTQIHYSCAQAERLDPDGTGPIRLTVAHNIGPGRNWTSLWKPTMDGLGPLVGSHPRPAKVLDDPRDGRITDLSLHREITSTFVTLSGSASGGSHEWARRSEQRSIG